MCVCSTQPGVARLRAYLTVGDNACVGRGGAACRGTTRQAYMVQRNFAAALEHGETALRIQTLLYPRLHPVVALNHITLVRLRPLLPLGTRG